MAQTTEITPKELERQAVLCFSGKTLKVMLCDAELLPAAPEDPLVTLSAENTVAEWQEAEKQGNGYVRFSSPLGTGSYDALSGDFVIPTVDAEFTASSGGYFYSRVVLYIEGEVYPHSIIAENPAVTLLSGQVQTYRLTLRQSP
jgi:hypothetical protein